MRMNSTTTGGTTTIRKDGVPSSVVTVPSSVVTVPPSVVTVPSSVVTVSV